MSRMSDYDLTLRLNEGLQERLDQEKRRNADLAKQLSTVREWMANQASTRSPALNAAVRDLSDTLLWSDAAEQPQPTASPGAIAATASLFERVAVLEGRCRTLEAELVKLGASVRDTNIAITSNNNALREVADMLPPELHPDEGKYDDGRG